MCRQFFSHVRFFSVHTSMIWRWHDCVLSRELERSSPPGARANSTALSRNKLIKCGVAGRCPHIDEVVSQVVDVFTHVGHACTLLKIVLVLQCARTKELLEKSQHWENVHRPDDGTFRSLLLDQKSEVLPEPFHLRPFQGSGWDTSHFENGVLEA